MTHAHLPPPFASDVHHRAHPLPPSSLCHPAALVHSCPVSASRTHRHRTCSSSQPHTPHPTPHTPHLTPHTSHLTSGT
eukprot:160077-Rhodomonas_salina.2